MVLGPILFSSLCSIAQVSVKNVDLIDGAPNVLYAGFNNWVQVVGLDSADFKDLKTNNGKVFRSNQEWSLFQISGTTGDTATVTVRTNGHGKSRIGFSVRKLSGEVHVSLGALTDTIATVNEILSDPTLHVTLPETYLKEWFHMFEFSLDLTSPSGSVMARFEDSGGNTLTQRQLDQIKLLEPGDVLRFTRLIATCPQCALRSLGTMTIHIK